MNEIIVRILREEVPSVQGIYLFGSAAGGSLTEKSDIDIAVLLPPREASIAGSLACSDSRFRLEEALHRPVDLVNLREVQVVFMKEIVASGVCLYAADRRAVDEFEMIVLSLYGKLNEERKAILADLRATGRAYDV